MTIEADLASDGSVDDIVAKVRGRFGPIDILVKMPASDKRRYATTIANARSNSGK